ncbi:MAG: excalibur calcium-binding domain-containing protein [Candidatus Nanosynbacter sp.]|nr:excalibur calcium-binding domain-containing protein [Candidatus Nanosynbacter sp.]
MAIKKFGQIQQKESKNKTSTKKYKRGWLIFGGVVVTLAVIGHVSNIMEQSRLEKDNVPIIISNVDENIKLDYHTDKREISAKISGVSLLAEVKVANGKTSIHGHKNSAGDIKYEIKGIKEGDSDISISVVDGKRHGDKIIKIHRQTKADYDKQELEKALKRTEESVKKAEQKSNDENISRAKSDVNKLPEDKRGQFSERIAKLEKAKQEEKERAEKAKKEAEEKKKQEEAAAAAAKARQQQQQARPQPAPRQAAPTPAAPQPAPTAPPRPRPRPATPAPAPSAELHFSSCKEARAAGYSHMRRGEPGYSPHLDRDGDGIACDKHK